MGLAQRRVKQRISEDPRNTRWANDTEKVGQKLLEQMGWKAGQGLGYHQHGIQENLKTKRKDDFLGVGQKKNKNLDVEVGWIQGIQNYDHYLKSLHERLSKEEEFGNKIKKKSKNNKDPNPIPLSPATTNKTDEKYIEKKKMKKLEKRKLKDLKEENEVKENLPKLGKVDRFAYKRKLLKAKGIASFSSSIEAKDDDVNDNFNMLQASISNPDPTPLVISTSKLNIQDYFKQRMESLKTSPPQSNVT